MANSKYKLPTYEIAKDYIFKDPVTKQPLVTLQTLNNWYKEIEASLPTEVRLEEIKQATIQTEQKDMPNIQFPPIVSSKKPYGFK